MGTSRFAAETKGHREAIDDPHRGAVPASVARGLILGAIGGAAIAGTEDGVRAWTGIAPGPALDERFAWSVAIGVLFGGVAGATGLRGARWCAPFVGLCGGWMLGGDLGAWFAAEGGIPHLAVIGGLLAGGVAGSTLGHTVPAPRGLLGGATGALVAITFADTAHLHLVAGPMTGQMIVIAGVAAVVGAAIAGIVGALAGTARSTHVGFAWGAIAVLGMALAAFAGAPRPVPLAAGSAHTPVIIALIDGLRADRAGFDGAARSSTPAMDRLLRNALVFPDATTVAPWPLPTVATVLTGRMPGVHGAIARGAPIRADIPTIAELVRGNGTICAAVTAGPDVSPGYGLDRGFSVYDYASGSVPTRTLIDPLVTMGLTPFPWPADDAADVVTDRAIAFMKPQTRPQWCMVVVYDDLDRPIVSDAAYDGRVTEVDAAVARLIAAAPTGARVIVAGTHGVALSEGRPGTNDHPSGVNYGHSLYQEVVHVPLAILGAGRAGRVTRPVSLLDVAPTALALMGAAPPLELTGRSLLDDPGGRTVAAECMRYGPEAKMARIGVMKMIEAAGQTRMWDLSTDPREITALTGVAGSDLDAQKALLAGLPPSRPADPPLPWNAIIRDLALRITRRPSPLRSWPSAQIPGLLPEPTPSVAPVTGATP